MDRQPPLPASPEGQPSDSSSEYSVERLHVLDNLDGLAASLRDNYTAVSLGDRTVYVRNDVLKTIDEEAQRSKAPEQQTALEILSLENNHAAQSIVRAIRTAFSFRPRLKGANKDKQVREERYRKNLREELIKQKEREETIRIDVAKFIKGFPPEVQKSLKTGNFLIEAEGRYYESVEEGKDSFAGAQHDGEFKKVASGAWRSGLFETVKAGLPFVTSHMPSAMTGAISSFKAELEDDVVKATVSGNNFNSGFGNNKLSCRVIYKEGGEQKDIVGFFDPI